MPPIFYSVMPTKGDCPYKNVKLINSCAEGECAKLSELEALLSCGDTDQSDAKNYAYKEIADAESKAAEDEPDYVSDGVGTEVGVNGLAEGGKAKASKLEALLTEGNTDKSDAPDDTG